MPDMTTKRLYDIAKVIQKKGLRLRHVFDLMLARWRSQLITKRLSERAYSINLKTY